MSTELCLLLYPPVSLLVDLFFCLLLTLSLFCLVNSLTCFPQLSPYPLTPLFQNTNTSTHTHLQVQAYIHTVQTAPETTQDSYYLFAEGLHHALLPVTQGLCSTTLTAGGSLDEYPLALKVLLHEMEDFLLALLRLCRLIRVQSKRHLLRFFRLSHVLGSCDLAKLT